MKLYTTEDVELCGNRVMSHQRNCVFTVVSLETDNIKTSHDRDPDRFPQLLGAAQKGAKFPPIVVDKDNVIMDGNTRLSAQTENGAKKLVVFKAVGELYTNESPFD
jgi:hypothetical protein